MADELKQLREQIRKLKCEQKLDYSTINKSICGNFPDGNEKTKCQAFVLAEFNTIFCSSFNETIKKILTPDVKEGFIDVTKLGLTATLIKPQLGDEADKSISISTGSDIINSMANLSPKQLIKAIFEPITSTLKEQANLTNEINLQTGIRGVLSERMREDMIQTSIEGVKYGITLKEIGETYTELVSKSGKLSTINKGFIDNIMPVSKSLNMTLKDYSSMLFDFENVGYGLTDTNERIEETIKNSLKLGLSATKTGALLKENVGKLNEYTFKNGYKGLEDMVKKSIEFKMEMATAFSFAEKVMDLDKSIEFVANMQMVGGAIGDLNDPLKLFYQANNDVEALQENIINAAKSLAVYNEQQQRFEITGINLRRARDMAQQFGISVSEFNKIGITALERGQALTSLMSSSLVFKNDEEKEFLINMSRMSKGQMVVNIPQTLKDMFGGKTEIALNELNNTQKEQLLSYQKGFEKMDIKQIAMGQYDELQKLVKNTDSIVKKLVIRGAVVTKAVTKAESEAALKKISDYSIEYDKKLNNYTVEEMKEMYEGYKEQVIEFGNKAIDSIFKDIEDFKKRLEEEKENPKKPEEPKNPKDAYKIDFNLNINGNNPEIMTVFQRELSKDPSILYNLFTSIQLPNGNEQNVEYNRVIG